MSGGARLLLAAAALLPPAAAPAEEMVRIAVATGQARVVLEGAGLTAALLAEGGAPEPVAGGRAEVEIEGGDLAVNGERHDAPGAVFAAAGPVRSGALALVGEVEVRRGEGGLDVVHAVPMEDYVAAVVEGEMPPAFPPEALKAQAVAARSFALWKKLEALSEGRAWHLGSTVLDQVYRPGRDERARAAAEATRGEVLVSDHEPVAAFFHSTCGGRTERGADALGRDLAYLAPVKCGHCEEAPRRRWMARVALDELGRLVGLSGPATSVRVSARTSTGRAARVEIAAGRRRADLAAADLRQRLGWDRIPSLAFSARVFRGAALFEGRGSGHGAGMCQWGAAGLAREGKGYRSILSRYYPGTEVVRIY